HIVGTERHESRRIDNQLRGRSGRQGDPGSSRFYLSLQDNLMRIFASDRVAGLMQRLGMEEGEAIEHAWVTKAIENAQRKVEAHNFDMRKNLLEYDDVANDQRKVVYEQRNELMNTEDVSDAVAQIRDDVLNSVIDQYIPPGSIDEQWNVSGLTEALEREFGYQFPLAEWLEADENLHEEPLRDKILESAAHFYQQKETLYGPEIMRRIEKGVLLHVLDQSWKEHLAAMDYLRQSVGLRGYAQKNPKQEYKRESFEMFTGMLDQMKHEVATVLARIQIQSEQDAAAVEQTNRQRPPMDFQHEDADSPLHSGGGAAEQAQAQPYVRKDRKIGRNEKCWCGSGKKFKHCHGRLNQ
ncbi:MAG: SEC-C metal-binding domain-containing protein, partial [Gammaproteobacteria bacterium]|nr:SEC-C metal-binding domain-containing protein [Gammaproteobacteria bacterium]